MYFVIATLVTTTMLLISLQQKMGTLFTTRIKGKGNNQTTVAYAPAMTFNGTRKQASDTECQLTKQVNKQTFFFIFQLMLCRFLVVYEIVNITI